MDVIKANNEQQAMSLQIYTMGQFSVQRGNIALSDASGRSRKMWDFFKCLLTFRDRGLIPDVLLETLWPQNDYSAPQRVARSFVYRLRQVLDCPDSKDSIILSTHGCYRLNPKQKYWLDADCFEKLCSEAQACAVKDADKAISLYQQALSLYKGDYLQENLYDEWVLPVRNYYKRMYLQSGMELCRLFEKQLRYDEVTKLCEQIFLIESLEEYFHLAFLNALIEQDKHMQARSHYEYVTSFFYRELGTKPSPEMVSLYRRSKKDHRSMDFDLYSIQEDFTNADQDDKGAFQCDQDAFRSLYELERRRGERIGLSIVLGLLSITDLEHRVPYDAILQESMQTLCEVLKSSLRRGDVLTKWNKSQYLFMLPGLNQEQAEQVIRRIRNRFSVHCRSNKIILRSSFQSLLPGEEYLA